MRIYCRLAEIMHERCLTVAELQRLSGVGRETIIALRRNCWKQVSRSAIPAICGALRIPLDELFRLLEENIWFPIALHREVTIHIGSSSLPGAPRQAPARNGQRGLSPQFADMWDVRAFFVIWDHLHKLVPDITVHFREHMNGVDPEPSAGDVAMQVFGGGNHIVIGSPASNQFAEEVVCRAFGVAPFTPRMRNRFPYNFVTGHRHAAASSFGRHEAAGPLGIASTRDGKLVARYNLVSQGEGEDCALIVVRRMARAPAQRRLGQDDESIVIAIVGHDGPGAYACARVAVGDRYAAALYPPRQNQSCMRVIAAKYERPPLTRANDRARDNRRITAADLIVEEEGGESTRVAERTVGKSGMPVGKTSANAAMSCVPDRLCPARGEGPDGCAGVTKDAPRG